MFTTLLLALVTHLVPVAHSAPPPETPIRVVSVRASSTLPKWKDYTFDAANLIDGRVDTSWQPAKMDTLGVGQWVELDLGEPHEISSIQIAQGLQTIDSNFGDLFCRNNRFAAAVIWFDDGTNAPIWAEPSERVFDVDSFYRGEELRESRVKTVTRYLRLIVKSVLEPVDWKDLAIAEVRVFGRPVAAQPTDSKMIAWDRPGAWPLQTAASDFCATKAQARRKRDCQKIISTLTQAWDSAGALPPVSVDDLAKGAVVLTFRAVRVIHRLEFQRATDGRWSVKKHTRVDQAGKPAPPGYETPTEPDSQDQNDCWEKLGKKRPADSYSDLEGKNGNWVEHTDEGGGPAPE